MRCVAEPVEWSRRRTATLEDDRNATAVWVPASPEGASLASPLWGEAVAKRLKGGSRAPSRSAHQPSFPRKQESTGVRCVAEPVEWSRRRTATLEDDRNATAVWVPASPEGASLASPLWGEAVAKRLKGGSRAPSRSAHQPSFLRKQEPIDARCGSQPVEWSRQRTATLEDDRNATAVWVPAFAGTTVTESADRGGSGISASQAPRTATPTSPSPQPASRARSLRGARPPPP